VLRPVPQSDRLEALLGKFEYDLVVKPWEQKTKPSFLIRDSASGKTPLGIGVFDSEPLSSPTCLFMTQARRDRSAWALAGYKWLGKLQNRHLARSRYVDTLSLVVHQLSQRLSIGWDDGESSTAKPENLGHYEQFNVKTTTTLPPLGIGITTMGQSTPRSDGWQNIEHEHEPQDTEDEDKWVVNNAASNTLESILTHLD
jgi:hypothetical protein